MELKDIVVFCRIKYNNMIVYLSKMEGLKVNKNVEDLKLKTLSKISTITKYGKPEKVETTEEEFNTYIKCKIVDSLETIKKIMIFLCVIMLIGLICTLITFSNM